MSSRLMGPTRTACVRGRLMEPMRVGKRQRTPFLKRFNWNGSIWVVHGIVVLWRFNLALEDVVFGGLVILVWV